MTTARQVLPGTVYLVTRRCSERRFFLRPSRATTRMFLYILAAAAERHGIRVHAFCVLSNHYHLVLTDPEANLPAFSQAFHGLVARSFNSILKRSESFWAPNSYSAVALKTPETVIAKIAYVLANPVAAGLVERGREWPGLWSAPEQIGGDAMIVERPRSFFRPKGPMPTRVPLSLHRPEGFASPNEFDSQLGEALAVLEAEAAAKVAAENRRFLGADWVTAQHPFGQPATAAPMGALRPRLACRDKWKRIEALHRLAEFARAYREAFAAWKKGVRDALFPPGTYQLRRTHGVRCAVMS
jgi:putative transposase